MAPYREENGRLLTQLNALHMENIALREHNEKHSKGMEAGGGWGGKGEGGSGLWVSQNRVDEFCQIWAESDIKYSFIFS